MGEIESIGDAIAHEEILRDGLTKTIKEREALAKKIESAKREQRKLIPKGNEARAKLLGELETSCIAAQGKMEALRRRLQTIEDLRTAATHLMGSVEPTRFTAMQQKYA